jgi:hypothetical protein
MNYAEYKPVSRNKSKRSLGKTPFLLRQMNAALDDVMLAITELREIENEVAQRKSPETRFRADANVHLARALHYAPVLRMALISLEKDTDKHPMYLHRADIGRCLLLATATARAIVCDIVRATDLAKRNSQETRQDLIDKVRSI